MDCWPHYPTYGGSETNFISGTRATCRKINEKKFCNFLDTLDNEKTYIWINQFSDFDSETRPWDKCRRSNIYYTYISFGKTIRGQATTPLRKKIMSKKSNIKNAKFEATSTYGSTSTRMFELLHDSKFGLVPRGDAMFSYRLMETMAMGVVPIIISDGWQLPFEDMLDWSEFSIRILQEMHIPVRRFDRMMFTAAVSGDTTRWPHAKIFSRTPRGQLGVLTKYRNEYLQSQKTCGQIEEKTIILLDDTN